MSDSGYMPENSTETYQNSCEFDPHSENVRPVALVIESEEIHTNLSLWLEGNKNEFGKALGHFGVIQFRDFELGDIEALTSIEMKLDNSNISLSREAYSNTEINRSVLYQPEDVLAEDTEFMGIDCRRLMQSLSSKCRKALRRKGLIYANYFTDAELSTFHHTWQESFGVINKFAVEIACEKKGIDYEWLANNTLVTREKISLVSRHSERKSITWINSLLLYLPCIESHEPENSETNENGDFSAKLYYEDGEPLEEEVYKELKSLIKELSFPVDCRAGDIILVDSMFTLFETKLIDPEILSQDKANWRQLVPSSVGCQREEQEYSIKLFIRAEEDKSYKWLSLPLVHRPLIDIDSEQHLMDVDIPKDGSHPENISADVSVELTTLQRRLWFLHQLNESSEYNILSICELKGKLDVERFSRAIEVLVMSNSDLRQQIQETDSCQYLTIAPAIEGNLTIETISKSELPSRVSEHKRHVFSMAESPLFYFHLYLTEKNSYLIFNVHHIISDGFSQNILYRQLSKFYNNDFVELEARLTFRDYAHGLNHAGTKEADTLVDSWYEKIVGAPTLINLPKDRPYPEYKGADMAASCHFDLSREENTAFNQLLSALGKTAFQTAFSLFAMMLLRVCRQNDFLIGTVVSTRPSENADDIVGFFANTLPMRIKADDSMTYEQFNEMVSTAFWDLIEHAELPFDKLVEKLNPERSLSYNPLIQVFFSADDQSCPLELDGLEVSFENQLENNRFDLSFSVQVQGPLCGIVNYNSEIFCEETITGLISVYKKLIVETAHCIDLPLVKYAIVDEYSLELLNRWNPPIVEQTYESLPQLFDSCAKRHPEKAAVYYEGYTYSYRDLKQKSETVASHLIAKGLRKEEPVAIFMHRGFATITAIYGVLKAGGCYVFLDPQYPPARLSMVLEDVECRFILCESHDENELLCGRTCLNVTELEDLKLQLPAVDTHQLAYILYTSGTTGKPKGVAVEHRCVSSLLAWAKDFYEEEEIANILAATSFSFDPSVVDLFMSLCLGGSLTLCESVLDIENLPGKECVSFLGTVPSAAQALLDNGHLPENLQVISLGGEVLQQSLVERLYRHSSLKKVYDAYGPTEDTVLSTCALRLPGAESTIGRPIANTQAHILDDALQPLPIGVVGELYLASDSLARGYYRNEKVTSEKFLQSQQGLRLYKTGDLVRWDHRGYLHYKGRNDSQIKLRGVRIEIGEVLTALGASPQVNDCQVVYCREDQRLLAYVVWQGVADTESLISFLKGRLPQSMIPSIFISLDSMPLTLTGKVDFKALPQPGESDLQRTSFTAPRTASEEILAGIWQEVLDIPNVGIEDNFFKLGGHSLIASQVISRIRESFSVDLALRSLFEYPTICELSEVISREKCTINLPAVEASEVSLHKELSCSQKRMWFLYRLEGGSATYNVPGIWQIKGVVDIACLQKSLDTIIDRHEILRTVFVEVDEEPAICVQESMSISITYEDLRLLAVEQREERRRVIVERELHQCFDLAKGPLQSYVLLQLAEGQYFFLMTVHHIISDAWSMNVFLDELSHFYKKFTTTSDIELPNLELQYSDFARWQNSLLDKGLLHEQEEYWKRHLDGAPALLKLPLDRLRPLRQSFRGDSRSFIINEELTASIHELCRESGTTLFMLLQSAFSLLLSRYSGEKDIVVGFPVANRNRQETEGLIGCFVNTLPLRVVLDEEESFRGLLKRVRDITLEAYQNQDLPLDRIVSAVRPERVSSYFPLFQVLFNMKGNKVKGLDLQGTESQMVDTENTNSKFDLILGVQPDGKHMDGKFVFNTDLFDGARIERMGGHILSLLKQLVAETDKPLKEACLLTAEEEKIQLYDWNKTSTAFPRSLCVHRAFEQQVINCPKSPAIVFGDDVLSYSEVNERANRLAHYLIERGLRPGGFAALLMDRSPQTLIVLIAILKAGGAYVSLDIKAPAQRLYEMLKDCSPSVVLTQKTFSDRLAQQKLDVVSLDDISTENYSIANPCVELNSNQLAYVCYTSGSTGRPKGVCITHYSVLRLVRQTNYIDISQEDTFLQYAPVSFDASTFEIWGALLNGARVVVLPPGQMSLADLADAVGWHDISILWLTAGLFNMMVEECPEKFSSVKQVLTGGEAISPAHAAKAVRQMPTSRLVNCYGPTENTTFTTFYELTQEDCQNTVIPIGRPVANGRIYILDEFLKPQPIGVPGEIYVAGDGVATGYLNLPELTAEKFINSPFVDNDHLYRTGDLGAYRSDGNIEYLGRRDSQVKIRGYRIELAEIEKNLDNSSLLSASCLTVYQDKNGGKSLVAYIVAAVEHADLTTAVKEEMRLCLPEYMIPSFLIVMNELPLNANGKIDRRRLPEPGTQVSSKNESQSLPVTELEGQLVEIWREVIGCDDLGIHDNFFAMGGHSLMMTKLISMINRRLCPELPLKSLFQAPTAAQMARVIEDLKSGAESVVSRPQKVGALFWVGGGIQFYETFQQYQDATQELVLLESYWQKRYRRDFAGLTMEKLIEDYIAELQLHQPEGPYCLGGYSIGGLIAFEVARRLQEQGHEILFLFLLDPSLPQGVLSGDDVSQEELIEIERSSSARLSLAWKNFCRLRSCEKTSFIINKSIRLTKILVNSLSYKVLFALNRPLTNRLLHSYALEVQYPQLIRNFKVQNYPGKLTVYNGIQHIHQSSKIWQRISDELDYNTLETSEHKEVLLNPIAEIWSLALRKKLEALYR